LKKAVSIVNIVTYLLRILQP